MYIYSYFLNLFAYIQASNIKKLPLNDRLEVYRQICANFRPALQYFFFERFRRPGEWYERRMAYTNSVATTSMVGYILGIGDRHVSNILIDEITAELIHIDFGLCIIRFSFKTEIHFFLILGIAFEQAKILPTPETVPFRLTHDIVAPFGVSGVDGVFRKACEKTMQVLRANKTTIITILEVLLYDPLYAWTMTTEKAYSRQAIETLDNNSDSGNYLFVFYLVYQKITIIDNVT